MYFIDFKHWHFLIYQQLLELHQYLKLNPVWKDCLICVLLFWFQWRTFMTKWMLLWHLKYHFLSLLQQLHFYRCCYFRRSVFSYPLYPNTCCQQYHCHYFTDPYPTWGSLQFWCYWDISFFYVYLKSVFQFRIIFIHWFDWLIIAQPCFF